MSEESLQHEAPPSIPPEEPVFWSYVDVAIFAGLAVPALLLAAIISRVFFALLGGPPPGKAAPLLIAQFLAYGLLFLALYLLFKLKYDRPFWHSLGWVRPAGGYRPALLTGPAVAVGVAVAGVLLKTPQIDMPIQDLLRDPVSIALMGIFATTLGPLCEELAFRGFLQPLLQRTAGVAAGIVIAALPFALLHGPQYAWSWRHIVLLLSAAIAFGWVRYKTGSTAATTLMHSTYNLTFFVAFLLQGKAGMSRGV